MTNTTYPAIDEYLEKNDQFAVECFQTEAWLIDSEFVTCSEDIPHQDDYCDFEYLGDGFLARYQMPGYHTEVFGETYEEAMQELEPHTEDFLLQ